LLKVIMFNAPKEIQAEVYATVPESLRIRDRHSGWSFGKGHGLHSFLEGPSFDRDGNLYTVDIPYGRIFRISPDGRFSVVAEYDGWPNGLKIHKDGRIFIADHLKGLLVMDPRTGKIEVLLDRIRREGLKGVNDLVFARNGDLYFTDQGQTGMEDASGRVYRLRVDGNIDRLIDTVPSPNGLALSPDEKILYVAVTRANQVWRLPLHPDGTTSKVGVFLNLSGGLAGPDGVAVDSQGNLAVAHCGLGTAWIFSRLGEPMLRVRSPTGLSTTNLAYGGPERRHLYITESDTGTILRAEVPVAGLPLFSHQ
jgi:gluconolactonase